MNTSKLQILFIITVLISITGISSEAFAQKASEKAVDASLDKVENRFVCMITDKVFEEEQIPVTVNGIKYYGCCNMCVEKLNTQVESRYAIDPISQKRINKAKAVIGADSDNNIYYFESLENLKQFDPLSTEQNNNSTGDTHSNK